MPLASRAVKRRVGLLTGTFDPVHLGHVELARAALRLCGLDEVWVHVNAQSEHKTAVTPYVHRLEMVRLALEGEPKVRLYTGVLAKATHTQANFDRIILAHSGTELLFIVGMDTLARLDRWDDFQSVVEQSSFAVAHRPGTPVQELEALRGRLRALGDRLKVQLFDFDDHGAASSTVIRSQLRAGRRPESLNGQVYEYILAHGLYGATVGAD